MKIMLVFPGQGSQYIGMGKYFYENYSIAKEIIDETDRALYRKFNNKLSDIIFNGTEEMLQNTEIAQPAIMTISVAIFKSLESELLNHKANNKIEITQCAGHSLGEYTALCCANAINITNCAVILNKRGELMTQTCIKKNGGMLAVLNSNAEKIQQIINESVEKNEILSIANDNSQDQIVISGHLSAIEKFINIATKNGIKKMIKLQVDGAFHSPLMKDAQNLFAKELNTIEIKMPTIPIIHNFSGKIANNIAEIKNNLINQITGQVKWREIIQNAIEKDAIKIFIEIGPKKVLTKLIDKISNGNAMTFNVDKKEDLINLKSLIKNF